MTVGASFTVKTDYVRPQGSSVAATATNLPAWNQKRTTTTGRDDTNTGTVGAFPTDSAMARSKASGCHVTPRIRVASSNLLFFEQAS